MINIDQYTNLILIMRQTARKYQIKVFKLNCIYIAYLYNKKDVTIYLSRFLLGKSVAKNFYAKNAIDLTKSNLITKIDNNVYLFTPLAIEVLNYIDEQLSNLESK